MVGTDPFVGSTVRRVVVQHGDTLPPGATVLHTETVPVDKFTDGIRVWYLEDRPATSPESNTAETGTEDA